MNTEPGMMMNVGMSGYEDHEVIAVLCYVRETLLKNEIEHVCR